MRLLSIAYLLLVTGLGCSPVAQRANDLCPPPPTPVCKPGSFDKTLLDTTNYGPGRVQTRITALPRGINSITSDNAITFVAGANGILAVISSDRHTADRDELNTDRQRMYAATFQSTMQYGPLRPIQEGTVTLPAGAAYYCTADSRLYFGAKAPNDDPNDFDLYSARLVDGATELSLTDAKPLVRLNLERSFDSQPTLDKSGTRLYFVSDRPGGMGGTDIWYAERSSASSEDWSTPRPVGAPINTECDELSPSVAISDPGTFYFASNGHETVGGYDLFKAKLTGATFGEPENLGKPINTTYDEIFPTSLNDTAFFWSSNMPSNGSGRDLYTITRARMPLSPEERLRFAQEQERARIEAMREDSAIHARQAEEKARLETPVNVYVHVTRGLDRVPAAGADLFVRRDSTEIYRGQVPASGNFLVKVLRNNEYDFGAEMEQTFFDVKHLDLRGYKDSSALVNLNLPDTLVLRINFPFDDYQHPYEFMIGENGEASTMSWGRGLDLTAASIVRSLEHMKQLVVIGHTDSMGTDAYNNALGLRRATFIAGELVKRGVPQSIMTVRSEGRKLPVARRPDESDDVFRLRSRRVEFIKVFK